MHASPLKPDQTVVFLSGMGSEENGGWRLQIHGWVYESEFHKPLTSLFRRAIRIREDELTTAEAATFRERAQYFLVDNKRRKAISIRFGQMMFDMSPSLANGHFQTNLHIRSEEIDRYGLAAILNKPSAEFEMVPSAKEVRSVNGQIQLIPATGISVISDIDDTIKISNVRNRKELLRNTFCRPYEPVAGMAVVYRNWEKNSGARFHYVSASPWQLYVPLTEFIQSRGFPDGICHFKLFRWKDQTALDLFKSPEKYKLATIVPLLKLFPHRKFVLVGDSGEKDPEIYGEIAREFPEQIVRILIRDVTSEPQASVRYKKAFSGISPNVWQIFETPDDLPPSLP